MKQIFSKILDRLVDRMIAKEGADWGHDFIRRMAHRNHFGLLQLAYNEMGILNYRSYEESGELFLVREVLRNKMGIGEGSIVFDVGANVGNYSQMLRNVLAGAEIYAFEPNWHAFSKLEATHGKALSCFNLGFGAEASKGVIYTYENGLDSSHASSYPGVFADYHRTSAVCELKFDMTTIDSFCRDHDISSIDFLKVDTEGNELNVMAGAQKMLAAERIRAIQFEFGECNVFSRVFLRDFYEYLDGYNLYRLCRSRLIDMSHYSVANEIFRYQNIFAVLKGDEVTQGTFPA